MKKILLAVILLLIVSCKSNSSNLGPAALFQDSNLKSKEENISVEKEKINNRVAPAETFLDSIIKAKNKYLKSHPILPNPTDEELDSVKLSEFRNEINLKRLSQKDFDFIINNLLEFGYGLKNYTYIDFKKINNGELETEMNSGPVDEMDERVKNKNFFVFEFNYGTHSSLREEYFLFENNEMRYIDFKLNESDDKKLTTFIEKIGGKGSYLSTKNLYEIYKDNQGNYELTLGLHSDSDFTGVTSSVIKYKTKNFETLVPNSVMKFDELQNKFVEVK